MTPRLVLISGPIASGKTTVAFKLAAIARQRGNKAASIDMDELIETVIGRDWSVVSREDRQRGRHIACAMATLLVDSLLTEGMDLVTIAGSTLSLYEWEHVVGDLHEQHRTHYVLLRVSLEESIRRARNDPSRSATSDPAIVRKLAARVDWNAIRQHDIELDTDPLDANAVAEALAMEVIQK